MIADPTTALIFGLSLVWSFTFLLIRKVSLVAMMAVIIIPIINSIVSMEGLKIPFSLREGRQIINMLRKAINPALPPTFGIFGPRKTLIKAASKDVTMSHWRFGRISREAIPTKAPQ